MQPWKTGLVGSTS